MLSCKIVDSLWLIEIWFKFNGLSGWQYIQHYTFVSRAVSIYIVHLYIYNFYLKSQFIFCMNTTEYDTTNLFEWKYEKRSIIGYLFLNICFINLLS